MIMEHPYIGEVGFVLEVQFAGCHDEGHAFARVADVHEDGKTVEVGN